MVRHIFVSVAALLLVSPVGCGGDSDESSKEKTGAAGQSGGGSDDGQGGAERASGGAKHGVGGADGTTGGVGHGSGGAKHGAGGAVGGNVSDPCAGIDSGDEGEVCTMPTSTICGTCPADPCAPCRLMGCSHGVWVGLDRDPSIVCATGGVPGVGGAGPIAGGAAGSGGDLGMMGGRSGSGGGVAVGGSLIEDGGATGDPCEGVSPSDDGEPCSSPGLVCGSCAEVDPCLPCAVAICDGGMWTRRESFAPPDCGEGGSSGDGGSSGEAGSGGAVGGSGGAGGDDDCDAYRAAATGAGRLVEACSSLSMVCPSTIAEYLDSLGEEGLFRRELRDGCRDVQTIVLAVNSTMEAEEYTFDRTTGELVGFLFARDTTWGPCGLREYEAGKASCSPGRDCTLADAVGDPGVTCPLDTESCGLGESLPADYVACTLDETATVTGQSCTYTVTVTATSPATLILTEAYQACSLAGGVCAHEDPSASDPLVRESCSLVYSEDACPTPEPTSSCLQVAP